MRHLTSDQLAYELHRADALDRTISEEAARTVASRWQHPGPNGWALAAFASGAPVRWQHLFDAVGAAYADRVPQVASEYRRELVSLAVYLMAVYDTPDTEL